MFEGLFKNKFEHQRTMTTLMKELLALKMEKTEKFLDFNHRFTHHLNNFSASIMPGEETLMEYYSSALSPQIAMFMKRSLKPLLLTKPKEERSTKLENVVKMVQKLSNKIVDLEKDKEAGSSKKPFRQFFQKKEENSQSQPPTNNSYVLNLTEVGMDNFCTFNQQPHSEKICP